MLSWTYKLTVSSLIRRSDCQTVRQPDLDDSNQDIDIMWHKVIDVELRKR